MFSNGENVLEREVVFGDVWLLMFGIVRCLDSEFVLQSLFGWILLFLELGTSVSPAVFVTIKECIGITSLGSSIASFGNGLPVWPMLDINRNKIDGDISF